MNALGITTLSLLLALPGLAAAQAAPSVPAPGIAHEPPTIPLYELVARVHQKTGRQFVLDPHAMGMVQVAGLDVDRIDYDMLLVILRQYGLVAIAEKDVVSIVSDAGARQLPTPAWTADDPRARDADLVTRVLQVRNACAAQMVPVLRPLMPQYAHLAAYPYSNTLIVMDRVDNLRRIAELVEKIDKAVVSKQDCGATIHVGG